MTELDLAGLRRIAESVCVPEPWAIWHDLDHQGFKTVGDAESYAEVLADGQADEADPIAHVYTDDLAEHIAAFDPPTVLALMDRIKELEAERDKARAEVERRPERDFVRAVIADRDKAEASLARVTDDSMAERIGRAIFADYYEYAEGATWEDDGDECRKTGRAVVATIRAVAADEQEAGR